MEHAEAMSVFDSTCDLCHELHTCAGCVAKRRCVLLQTSIFREFHAEKRQAVLAFTHFVNRKDVGVIQTGHRLCFSSETFQRFMRISAITKNPLYRDDAPGMSLSGAINHANSGVESQGCSTLFAFCVLFGSARKRIGAWF